MSAVRSEVSKKNKYWISKHRYYELKHFCMQYPEWTKELKALDGYKDDAVIYITDDKPTDQSCVEKVAEKREYYLDRIAMLEAVALDTDPDLGETVLRGAIWGLSYDIMNAHKPIPCSRDTYYDLYRKFFWLLNSVRK